MNQSPDLSLIRDVALETGIAESFVEKDWFVVQVIRTIAAIEHQGFEVVFSGGMALSKAHELLQRFSEDVDFRVLVPEGSDTVPDFKTAVEAVKQLIECTA